MTRNQLEQAAVWLLHRTPRRAFSTLVGSSSRRRWPPALTTALLNAYSRLFGVNISEAEKELDQYDNVNDFFIRRLRPGCRPIAEGERVAVSPVDAMLVQNGSACLNNLVQAKGISYDLTRLLGTAEVAHPFRDGPYVTLYLKPGYYHRIHSPLKGNVQELFWIPGDRFPVVPLTVRRLPELYNLNERKVVVLQTAVGAVAIVMVAALGVSNITLSLSTSNGSPSRPVCGQVYRLSCPSEHTVQKGDELGIFQLGSTVIVLFEPGRVRLRDMPLGTLVRMGEAITV